MGQKISETGGQRAMSIKGIATAIASVALALMRKLNWGACEHGRWVKEPLSRRKTPRTG
jgi:hypothetical protein